MFREGLLIVISGPSGAGKGTLLKTLKEKNGNVQFSVSATTRNPRLGEVEGQSYFFKSVEEFQKMIDNDELIEWVQYCDNYYGTPKRHIEESISMGMDYILEIDVEGALNIKKKFQDCVLVFIIPPSFAELRKRLQDRGTEGLDVIEKRLEKSKKEITQVDKYDYIVMNDKLEDAVDDINSIFRVEKLKYARNVEILKYIGI